MQSLLQIRIPFEVPFTIKSRDAVVKIDKKVSDGAFSYSTFVSGKTCLCLVVFVLAVAWPWLMFENFPVSSSLVSQFGQLQKIR